MSDDHCGGIYDSIRNGCLDCMKVFYNDKFRDKYSLTNLAVEHGQLHIVMYFRQRGLPFSISTLALAAEFGHLNVVKYLLFAICIPSCDFDYRGAAVNEQLHIINYLTAQGVSPNVNAYYGAIEGGHLYIVKYLRQKNFPWDESVINRAIKCGNLSILIYLHKHGCKIGLSAINTAAKFGQLDCLKYLRELGGCAWDFLVSYYAEINNDVKILQYLHENNYPHFEYCGTYAAANGSTEALKFLHDNGYKLWRKVCDRAAENQKYKTAEYLCSIGYLPRETRWCMMDNAAEKGDVDTLRLLLKYDEYDAGNSIAYIAASNGHVNVLVYLQSIGHLLPCDLDYFAFNKIDVLKYLNTFDHKFGKNTLRKAADNGRLDTVNYLLSVGCPYDMGIWYTDKMEVLVYMHNKKLDHCPDIVLQKITRHINDLAFKEAKIVRRGFIPTDVWNIIGRMM